MDVSTKPRILITGAQGQVGFELVDRLSSHAHVVGIDKDDVDLCDKKALEAYLDALKPQLIINPAAYTAVDRAEDEQSLAHILNAEVPEFLASYCKAHGIYLVHFSTDYVFNGKSLRPWQETDTPEPLSVYGKTKLAGEQAVLTIYPQGSMVFRLSWVYSWRGRNFVFAILDRARKGESLRVVSDQHGAPTSAGAIADALAQIFVQNLQDLSQLFESKNGLYHCSAAGQTTWYQFACAVMREAEKRSLPFTHNITPIATEEFPTKATRPRWSVLDNSKFERAFGFRLPPWEEQLAQIMERLAKVYAQQFV